MADELPPSWRFLHLTISGLVQGVSFRAWMQGEALGRDVSGWVRNRANGDVEAVLAGAPDLVQTFCEVCRSGPPMARVDQILIGDASPSDKDLLGPQGSFLVLPTV